MKEERLFSNKNLRILLLPLIVEQILNSLMGTVDTIMVSNVSPQAMSAASLVDSINTLVIQAFAALATGGAIVCAQYIGNKNVEMAKRSAEQVVLAVGMVALVITLVCQVWSTGMLRLIFGSVETGVMDAAKTYFFYTSLSFPFIALYNSGAAIFRVQGNSKTPMAISLSSNIINIVFNAVFIWVFQMGVAGVAISTLVSRIISAVAVFWYLQKPKQSIVIKNYLSFRPNWQMIGRILKIGVPSGVENSMFQFGKLFIQSTVSTMGTMAIAAQAMTNILEGLNGMAAIGVGIGLMTVVGQCIGAGRKDEAVYYVKKLTIVAEVVLATSCLLVFVLLKPIMLIAGMEPESMAMTATMMLFITIVKPIIWIFSFIPGYGMRAAGDVKFSMILSTASMWICRVSLCIYLARVHGMGPMAVWIGMFADWGVRGIIFTLRFHSRKWLNHKIIN